MGTPCETLPNNITGIYKIKNIINGKIYVGQSVNIRKRILEHLRESKKDNNSNLLYSEIRTYVPEQLKQSYIEKVLSIYEVKRVQTIS